MTIVEFFDTNHVENIVSALTCNPDKVILVGSNRKRVDKYVGIYKEIAGKRGLRTEFLSEEIKHDELDDIIEKLTQIVELNENCIFDLEGGDDLFLVATGYVAGKYPDRVRLHRFNISNNTMFDCDSDGELAQVTPMEISIEENVKIYAGQIIDNEQGFEQWKYTDDFKQDIFELWEICKEDPKEWNDLCSDIAAVSKNTYGSKSFVLNQLTFGNEWKTISASRSSSFKKLHDISVIKNLRIGSDGIYFDFKDEQIKRCLIKGGQVLELYVTFYARDLYDPIGKPVYNDVMCSVNLDWDHPLVDNNQNDKYKNISTSNEIDVILMKGMVPVFISCKNGTIDKDEPYKLAAVTERFGGKFAKKVLILTEKRKGVNSVLARAEDMNIKVISNFASLDPNELKKVIRNLWK